MCKKNSEVETTEDQKEQSENATVEQVVKRGRGRPKGSKNKPKFQVSGAVEPRIVTTTVK